MRLGAGRQAVEPRRERDGDRRLAGGDVPHGLVGRPAAKQQLAGEHRPDEGADRRRARERLGDDRHVDRRRFGAPDPLRQAHPREAHVEEQFATGAVGALLAELERHRPQPSGDLTHGLPQKRLFVGEASRHGRIR